MKNDFFNDFREEWKIRDGALIKEKRIVFFGCFCQVSFFFFFNTGFTITVRLDHMLRCQ